MYNTKNTDHSSYEFLVAQLVELLTNDQKVVGSNPTQAKIFILSYHMFCKEVVNLCVYIVFL